LSDSLMLVCSVLCSLAIGVLAAYGVCLSMFALFRMHAGPAPVKPMAMARETAAGTPSVVEG